jgi:hypothetical protein
VVEQQRALSRPRTRAVGLKDHGREQLDPVGDELAVVGLANLAGLKVEAKTPGAVAGNPGGVHVGGAGADGSKRLRDPPGDELVVARRLRTLTPLDLALAVIARAMPGLLTRQQFSEHVWLAGPRRALVALPAMPWLAVGASNLIREPA